MENENVRRFALGSFLLTDAAVPSGGRAIENVRGSFWVFAELAAFDEAKGALERPSVAITIETWRSASHDAVIARLKTESTADDGTVQTAHDRREGDLPDDGMLETVAEDWLGAHIRKLARDAPKPKSKRELEKKEKARKLLATLVEAGAIAFEAGSSADDILERTERVLFVVARTRRDAVAHLGRMLRSSKHLQPGESLDTALVPALDAIAYRR